VLRAPLFRLPALSRTLAACCAVLGVCALSASHAERADAAIVPAQVLDGPNASVLEVDGASLASDGTGGVVFRALSGGEPHVFASRFLDGAWQAPIQVDEGQLGPATFPTIAAGDGGELLVVWVQPWKWISASPGAQATLHYELMSAVLQPGAQSFSQIERIADVGDGSAAYPSLAMAPDGSAYVAYRVVTNPLSPGTTLPIQPMRLGDELVDVHVARFNGLSWSNTAIVNSLPGQVTMRKPSATNAPVVVVNDRGQALVVWQEPEIDGVARIWARRIFGTTLGNVLQVSPSSVNGSPVTVDADAPALSLGDNGQAAVAFRLAGGAGSPLGSPHVLLNTLTMPVSEEVSAFSGAVALDGASTIGPPSVAINGGGELRVAYTAAGQTRVIAGEESVTGSTTTRPPVALGQASGEAALATVAPEGGGVAAWPAVDAAGLPVLDVNEEFAGGGAQGAELSAPLSGPVSDLVAGESGAGDALLAFRQGPTGDSQVMASFAQTPPQQFLVKVPLGWVKGSAASISWEAAPDTMGGVTYSVLVDGRTVAQGLAGLSYQLDARELGDGTRRIQVLASDQLGQRALSSPASLHVESNPPQVSVKRLRGDRVQVRVYDDPAGVKKADTLVAFGDGTSVKRRDTVTHRYKKAGGYTIVVHATDAVGNVRDAHVLVEIR
jgi:PKD domain